MSKSTATTVATETTWATNGGAVAAYQENGYQKVMIVDNPDCDVCSSRDGAIVDADSDISPAHNHCTVSVVPVGSGSQNEPPLIEGTPLGDAEYDAMSNDLVGSLSRSEKRAVERYTGIAYSEINDYLRGYRTFEELERFGTPKELADLVAKLDAVVKRQALDSDILVYRGFHEEAAKVIEANLGKVLRDEGFISTSISEAKAREYSARGLLAEVKIPKGTNVAAFDGASLYPEEKELLLSRGTQFRVVGIRNAPELRIPAEGGAIVYPEIRIVTLEVVG